MRGLFKNRFTTLSLSLAAMLVLAACGGGGDGNGAPDTATLTVNAGAGGNVESMPEGINTAEGNDEASFEIGTDIRLVAEADEGFVFNGWSGVDACGDNAVCEFELTENTTVSAAFLSTANAETVEAVADGANTSEEMIQRDGEVTETSSTLELGVEPREGLYSQQHVGVRFENVEIPAGATVVGAKLIFTAAAEPGTAGEVPLVIHASTDVGELGTWDADNTNAGDLSGRIDASVAPVEWSITEAWEAGAEVESPDVSSRIAAMDEPGDTFVFIVSPAEVLETLPENLDFRRALDSVKLEVSYLDNGADDGADEGEGEA